MCQRFTGAHPFPSVDRLAAGADGPRMDVGSQTSGSLVTTHQPPTGWAEESEGPEASGRTPPPIHGAEAQRHCLPCNPQEGQHPLHPHPGPTGMLPLPGALTLHLLAEYPLV